MIICAIRSKTVFTYTYGSYKGVNYYKNIFNNISLYCCFLFLIAVIIYDINNLYIIHVY